ncbi:MAG: sialidase, partial [Gemmatimonadaceae bacterium]
GITRGLWSSVGGGESGWAQPDPVDSNLVWSSASGFGSVGGIVTRWDIRTNMSTQVEIWPRATIGHAAEEVKYRFVWTFPLTISPHDHNRVYAGSQFVHVTTNGGRDWQVISPDLSRNDRSHLLRSGGLTPDNIGVEYAGVVFAIAESPKKAGVIWAGTNDGKVHITQDAGKSWSDLTANLPGLPMWGTISNIEASRYDEATAYLSVDGHQINIRDPYIYKTTDYGKTWKLLVNGIPKSPLSYVHVVREDPAKRGLLYAGTENAVYVSFNDGERWQPLNNNLPHAPVYWITVQEHFNDLVIATYGRGFWILDDISALRALGSDIATKDIHLFAPRAAYRFRQVETPFADGDDPNTGTNPPYGASIDYWLKADRKDSLTLTVSDASGTVVRTAKLTGKAGMNRYWWDLRTDLTKTVKLRTANVYSPEVKFPPEGKEAPGVGRMSHLVLPGVYTVRLAGLGEPASQSLTVRKDPTSGGSEEEIKAQTEAAGGVRQDLSSAVDMINSLEVVRSQIAALKGTLADDDKMTDVRAQVDSMEKKLLAVQEDLMQMRTTGRGQDQIRWSFKLAEQLIYLYQSLTGSDFAPTTPQREVKGVLHEELQKVRARYEGVMSRDLDAFKAILRARNVQNAIIS